MSYDNKKFLDANGVTQIVGLLDDYATNETLSTVVNSVQTALDQKVDDVQINETSILNNRVANIPIAGSNVLGVVKTKGSYGLAVSNDGSIKIAHAGEEAIKSATIYPNPIIPSTQHISTFYGLSKAAGVDLANETVTFGIYPETSKTAIRTMLGAVGLTDYANQNTGGVVKIIENGSGGFQMSSGYLLIKPATIANVKSGTNGTLAPLVPGLQDASTFYGLAKAAGDTTQSQSDNAVGTYTNEAKTAIQTMLGVEPGTTLVETVSGTTPSVTALPNVRYNCGEVATISITPPANGTCDVFFTSGTTAAVLTVPSTVKFPSWFDSEALETDTIYEIMITDGVYGSVMAWVS